MSYDYTVQHSSQCKLCGTEIVQFSGQLNHHRESHGYWHLNSTWYHYNQDNPKFSTSFCCWRSGKGPARAVPIFIEDLPLNHILSGEVPNDGYRTRT